MDKLLRDSGHAEADGRQVYQQASGAQLDLRVQMQTVLQEILFQKQPGGRLPLQQDQRELGNLLQGIDMVKVAGILRPGHKDGMGGQARERLQRRRLLRGAGKGNIHLAGLQQAQDLMAAAGDDLNVDGRVLPVEPVQVRQQKLAGNGVAGADGQVAHLQIPALGQLFFPCFQQAHGAADVFIQHPPVGGQGDAPGVPGEQAGLKLRLQLLDGLADGRLGYKQSLGRGGNVSGLGHFLENAIKLQLHGHNSTSLRKIMRVGLLSAVIISDIFRNATPICISPEDSAFFPISSCFFRGPSV